MVNKKTLVLGIIILICVFAISTTYLLVGGFSEPSFHQLNISDTCYCMVPDTDNFDLTVSNNIQKYVDYENELNVTSYNTQSESGRDEMNKIIDSTLIGEEKSIKGVTVHYNQKTGVYSVLVGNSNSHDNVLITCKDVDLLLRVYNSILFKHVDVEDTNSTSDDSNTDSSNHANSVKSSSSSESSSTRAGQPEGYIDRDKDFD